MNMADIGEYLAKLDAEFKMLKDFVTATNTSTEPQFFGTPSQISPVFAKLGIMPSIKEKGDVPGWLDDLADAFASDNPVLLRQNRKGEQVPARWYEYLEDGSIGMVIGDYLYAPLMGINAFVTAGGRGRKRAASQIDEIRREYPLSQMSTEDFVENEMKKAVELEKERIDKAAEVEKERIRNTPIKLKYKRGTEEGEIEVIPAMTSNFPWYNLGGLGGVAGDSEGYVSPEDLEHDGKPQKRKGVPEYMKFGGVSPEYEKILEGLINRDKEYAIQLKLHGEAINKSSLKKDKPLDKDAEFMMYR